VSAAVAGRSVPRCRSRSTSTTSTYSAARCETLGRSNLIPLFYVAWLVGKVFEDVW
jgi:hypothetical protein